MIVLYHYRCICCGFLLIVIIGTLYHVTAHKNIQYTMSLTMEIIQEAVQKQHVEASILEGEDRAPVTSAPCQLVTIINSAPCKLCIHKLGTSTILVPIGCQVYEVPRLQDAEFATC